MTRPEPVRSARRMWPLAALVLALVAVGSVVGLRAWLPAPTSPVSASDDAPVALAAPLPFTLPEQPRVLIFGDSWTYGSAASLPTLGYAYVISDRLGWDSVVDGVRGSGYLKPGLDGGSFGERIAELDPDLDPDLIIVEGSINDRRLPADGYRDAVNASWDALRTLYPEAKIVILGPAPQILPVEDTTARIDADLAALAGERGWWYISPIGQLWIDADNYATMIDTAIGRDHPSTTGHAYLATRLAEALDEITGAADPAEVVAEAPADGDPTGR